MDWYWRCIVCGGDVLKGTSHACAVSGGIAGEGRASSRLPRSPWPAVEFAPYEVGKE